MKVAIEARALSRPASGITTYVRQLVSALARVSPRDDLRLLENGPQSDLSLPLWLNTVVPRWVRAQEPDIVHFTKAAVPLSKRYPTVVTIYDVIPILFPVSQKTFARLAWPVALRHAARVADHIITISDASKRDIVEHLHIQPNKISVTQLAVEILPFPSRENGKLSYNKEDVPYILFLSTLEPRKNVPALIRSFSKIASQVPHNLLIGGRAHKGLESIEAEIDRVGLRDRVQILGMVSGAELPALYSGADLFVLPSVYEGWSFPAQEAMASGVPVIVSNGGALPEVVGYAGEIVPFTVDAVAARTHDEAFEAALTDRMRAVLTDPAKQSQMRQAGLLQVQKFSWDDVARKTIEVYKAVVKLS